MDQRSGFVALDGEKLHYLQMGQGPRLLLCFHGYRNTASLFTPFSHYLGKDFTLICLDLPHHGKSQWSDTMELSRKHMVTLVEHFLKEFNVEKVSLAGYSIGGRLCLQLIELVPEKIEQALLIASDGLVFNWFYYFMTRHPLGKRLFNSFLSNPSGYLKYVDWLHKKGLINDTRYRFFMNYVDSEGERRFLLKVWPGLRSLVPERRKLTKAIRSHHTPIYLFMGEHDPIIPQGLAHRFKKGLDSVQLFILDKGHRVFDSDSLPRMARCLITGTC